MICHFSVWQCMTCHFSVWQCMTCHFSVWQCMTCHFSVWQCMTCHFSVWQCMTCHFSVWQCMTGNAAKFGADALFTCKDCCTAFFHMDLVHIIERFPHIPPRMIGKTHETCRCSSWAEGSRHSGEPKKGKSLTGPCNSYEQFWPIVLRLIAIGFDVDSSGALVWWLCMISRRFPCMLAPCTHPYMLCK